MNSVGNIKRFHIGKVYRRDNPNTSKGRFREFYQCDFDVAGNFPMMVADSEVLAVAVEILSELPIGGFTIKLNHRKLLDSIFEICGVASENFRPICSAVDKLDKTPWDLVKKEMVEEKGLTPEVADRIGNYVLFNGKPMELWERLTQEKVFGDHERAREAMHELQVLFGYLQAMDVLDYISFDLSLARGLDYYTGVIYVSVK
jgi:histidyl-tRNA synthetase